MFTFFQNGYNFTKEQLQIAARAVLALVVILVVLAAAVLYSLSRAVVPAEAPNWEAVLAARLIFFRALVAPALAAGAVLMAFVLFYAVDKTPLGRRLFHWEDSDPIELKSVFVRQAGMTLAALLLGTFILASAVLR